MWKKGLSLVGKTSVLAQREGELDEDEGFPSASQRGGPGGGNGSRAQILPVATMPPKYRDSPVIVLTDLFALGIRDRQRSFDGFWIKIGGVDLFPEHGSKILDLELRPIDKG